MPEPASETGTAAAGPDLLGGLRAEARDAPESGIVAVMNHGRGRQGLIPLWAGEGDLPTPAFIAEAAARSLAAGETFYTWQRGLPELREALAAYHARLYRRAFSPERFFVTGSGMQAIQIAVRMVAGSGDEVIVPVPSWPNIAAAIDLGGARAVPLALDFRPEGWRLDLDRLFAAVGPATRGIFINSPANPTGWTAPTEALAAIVDFCRARGLWIIADEVYGRFVYGETPAGRGVVPSFHDVAEAEDRILYVNTFSKNWAMTGWRIGWLAAPVALGQVIENLVQYSTSGVAAFMQRAAIVALEEGEPFVALQVERAARGRALIGRALAGSDRVRFAWPDGAFYAFFSVEGEPDPERLAFRLVDEAGIGLAPGSAFSDRHRGFLRACFARRAEDMEEAARRLAVWLGERGGTDGAGG